MIRPRDFAVSHSNVSRYITASSAYPKGCRCFTWAPIRAAKVCERTFNPIRSVVDKIQTKPQTSKPLIALSIGDPTIYGNFSLPDFINEKLADNLRTLKFNGYPNSCGLNEAREAVARAFSPKNHPISGNDVVITSGCSQALDFAISALANAHSDENILIPRPGFSLYETLLSSKGIKFGKYDLRPERNWEIDIPHLKSLINHSTKAIVVNNPSNPTGSVFTGEHIRSIIEVAEEFKLPIIADEIYANMVFKEHQFHSFSSLSSTVPIIEAGGLAKQFMIPGWRIGWVILHDRNNCLGEIRDGIVSLSQLTLGPASIIQSIVPDILSSTPREYLSETMLLLEKHSQVINDSLEGVIGLKVIPAQGAMYTMVKIDTRILKFDSDTDFSKGLLMEEAVFVLPGQCFSLPNFIRLVTTPPIDKLEEACRRIKEFCERNRR